MSNNGGVYTWSKTAAANAGADNTVNWAEGQAPSSVNDSARALMTSVAKFRDDISGAIITTGTSAAYIVASNQVFDTLANFHGKLICFSPHVTNAVGPVTMTVDGFANLPVRTAPGVELLAGTIIQGTPYTCTYNNTDGALYLHGFYGNPYSVPLGSGLDHWLPLAPNSSFAFPIGQAISRTTYATLFNGPGGSGGMGTTFGAGDGSTTFNLPDKRERVSVMMTAAASRLTAAGFGGNSTVMGAVGGLESEPLALGHLPTGITSANLAAFAATSARTDIFLAPNGTLDATVNTSGGSPGRLSNSNSAFIAAITSNVAIGAAAVTSNNTGSQAAGGAKNVPTVQPTIVCNYIIRII